MRLPNQIESSEREMRDFKGEEKIEPQTLYINRVLTVNKLTVRSRTSQLVLRNQDHESRSQDWIEFVEEKNENIALLEATWVEVSLSLLLRLTVREGEESRGQFGHFIPYYQQYIRIAIACINIFWDIHTIKISLGNKFFSY